MKQSTIALLRITSKRSLRRCKMSNCLDFIMKRSTTAFYYYKNQHSRVEMHHE